VLDASGFSYSDQWGFGNSKELAKSCKRWKKNGTKIVLLPQAFGPFTSLKSKDAMKSVADCADLIFARERISYDHLVNVVGERSTIKISPDFTNLLSGSVPENFDSINNRFCIVPNFRMIDKTSKEDSEAYLPFMVKCVKYLLNRNMRPFVLIHEGPDDLMLAEKIRDGSGGVVPIIEESNPLKIKGILAACEGTIGSRFHGLVNALSQGVPSLATGWSHKYQMLFEDYGFSDGLMDVTMSDDDLHKKIDLIVNPQTKDNIKKTITAKSKWLKNKSLNMWSEIFKLL
jgi:colanic acid/amylovoran biosynthesis protein